MEKLTWKHVAMLAIFVIAVLGVAVLYTFGGEAGQEAASNIGGLFVVVAFFWWALS